MINKFLLMFIGLKLNGEMGVEEENHLHRELVWKPLSLEFGHKPLWNS